MSLEKSKQDKKQWLLSKPFTEEENQLIRKAKKMSRYDKSAPEFYHDAVISYAKNTIMDALKAEADRYSRTSV